MLGQIKWTQERRISLTQGELCGLPLLSAEIPERARGRERSVGKAAGLLTVQQVSRVLVPPRWDMWPELLRRGLRPVDTRPLRCALAPEWVRAALRARGISPQCAVLSLSGEWESSDMIDVARTVCPWVRHLVIDVPRGRELALQLQREYGLPVLHPGSVRPDLTLHFSDGPELEGAVYRMKDGRKLPADCDGLSVLSALWETRRIERKDIALLV